jgi:chromosomal replication initiation ATPase DnaA
MGFKFEINKAGMDKLEQDLKKRFAAGIEVALDGSEDEAILSVKEQLKDMGVTPNDTEVERLVREVRQG